MMASLKWFGPKRFGWGIRPIHPMGWVVLALSLVGFVIGVQLTTAGSSALLGLIIAGLSILLIVVVSFLSYDKSSR